MEGDDNVFIDAKRLISIAKDNGADVLSLLFPLCLGYSSWIWFHI